MQTPIDVEYPLKCVEPFSSILLILYLDFKSFIKYIIHTFKHQVTYRLYIIYLLLSQIR